MKRTTIALTLAATAFAGSVSAQNVDCSVAANAETDACLNLPTVSSQSGPDMTLPLILGGSIAVVTVAGALSGGGNGSNSTSSTPGTN